MVSRSTLLALLLLAAPYVASAYPVHAPFFVEQHETGTLRAAVFHGTREGDETHVFCGDAPERETGKNEIHCFKVDTNEYELRLPYTFDRDPDTALIRGINFNDDHDGRIIIPFTTVLDDRSRMHAVVNAGDSAAYSQIIIPYSIRRAGEDVFAVERNENDEEEVVLLRFRENGDGFMSIVYDGSLDVVGADAGPANKFGSIASGVFIGLVVVFVVCKRSRSGREPAGEEHELHRRSVSSFV